MPRRVAGPRRSRRRARRSCTAPLSSPASRPGRSAGRAGAGRGATQQRRRRPSARRSAARRRGGAAASRRRAISSSPAARPVRSPRAAAQHVRDLHAGQRALADAHAEALRQRRRLALEPTPKRGSSSASGSSSVPCTQAASSARVRAAADRLERRGDVGFVDRPAVAVGPEAAHARRRASRGLRCAASGRSASATSAPLA